jgi:hypothetical protein
LAAKVPKGMVAQTAFKPKLNSQRNTAPNEAPALMAKMDESI